MSGMASSAGGKQRDRSTPCSEMPSRAARARTIARALAVRRGQLQQRGVVGVKAFGQSNAWQIGNEREGDGIVEGQRFTPRRRPRGGAK